MKIAPRRPALSPSPAAAGAEASDVHADADVVVGSLPGGTQVMAASVATGRAMLGTVDDYVRRQSPFDRQARVNLRREVVEVTPTIYLDYVTAQVMAWSPAELQSLRAIVTAVADLFASLSLRLPDVIRVVKTTGQEEGYAAYTRRQDTIVLPANMVASTQTAASYGDPLHPADDLSYLQNVFIHECFHLFSKNHPAQRLALYHAVHYQVTPQPIELPDVPWGPPGHQAPMRELRITNPDESGLDVYIDMQVPVSPIAPTGAPSRDADDPALIVRRSLAPLLLADRPYDGGVFFDYLHWWFLAITRDPSGRWVPMLDARGQPLLYDSAPLMSQYLSLVTDNFTQEIFQPDEILAQNFVLMANQPSLDILSTLRRTLSATPDPS